MKVRCVGKNEYVYDSYVRNTKCFDYGDFVSAREIEDSIDVDVRIVPNLIDTICNRQLSLTQ